MTISILDDAIIGPAFITDEVRAHYMTSGWLGEILRVEHALAQAQASLDIVPQEAADAIGALDSSQFDMARLHDRTAQVGFPLVAITEQITELLDEGLGEYAHWGATTQDIFDTVQVILAKAATGRLEAELVAIGELLSTFADEERDTLMLARSQGQAALPTTFGLRAAGWLSGVNRHLERLTEMQPRVLAAQLSGAVGTAASFGPQAEMVQREFANLVGLGFAPVSWHTQRDGHAEIAAHFAGIAGSLGKIGLDVALASQSGIDEMHEGPPGNSGGTSSTMPQKRNAILAQQVVQNARLARSLSATMHEAMVTDNDRGTGVWPIEWFALPQLLALTESSAGKARQLLETLTIDRDAMAKNLEVADTAMAESVMMHLAPKLGRQKAHDLVADAIRSHPDVPFAEALKASDLEVDASVLDPMEYLGTTQNQIDAAISHFTEIQAARR